MLKGQKHSEKSKKKISLSKIGHSVNKGRKPWNTGKKRPPFSEEWRKKMSLSHAGKKLSEEHKIKIGLASRKRSIESRKLLSQSMMGLNNHFFGKKHTDESRKKISSSLIGKIGKQSRNWREGRTKLSRLIRNCSKIRVWRERVFGKNNWTCQKCYIRGGKLHAHHVKSFSNIIKEEKIKKIDDISLESQLWDTKNGLTLCIPCHKRLHEELKLSKI